MKKDRSDAAFWVHGVHFESSDRKLRYVPGQRSPSAQFHVEHVNPALELLRDKIDEGRICLTPTFCDVFDDLVERSLRAGSGVQLDYITTHEAWSDGDAAEWFSIDAQHSDHIDAESAGLPKVDAHRLRRGVDIALGAFGTMFCSARVREAIRDAKLTGIEFLLCRDVGRFAAPKWYRMFSHAHLGRGVDHPWLNRESPRPRRMASTSRDDRNRDSQKFGMWNFDLRRAHPAKLPGLLTRILKTVTPIRTPCDVALHMTPHLLRLRLPTTDFAHTFNPDHRRRLACTRDVRDLLTRQGFTRDVHFAPMRVVNALPDGARDFDVSTAPPPTVPPPDVLAKLRELEAKQLRQVEQHPKPDYAASVSIESAIASLLKRVSSSMRAKEGHASAKAIAEAEAKLGVRIPHLWQRLVSSVNGCSFKGSSVFDEDEAKVFVISLQDLASVQADERATLAEMSELQGRSLLVVVRSDFGDLAALDLSKVSPAGDCPVYLISHENGSRLNTWPSIAHFVDELAARRSSSR